MTTDHNYDDFWQMRGRQSHMGDQKLSVTGLGALLLPWWHLELGSSSPNICCRFCRRVITCLGHVFWLFIWGREPGWLGLCVVILGLQLGLCL